jgi:hypothetical protein
VDVETHVFLSALVWGDWSATSSGRFTSEEKAPDTHWTGGQSGRCGEVDSDVSVVQAVTSRYTDCATADPK